MQPSDTFKGLTLLILGLSLYLVGILLITNADETLYELIGGAAAVFGGVVGLLGVMVVWVQPSTLRRSGSDSGCEITG